MDKATTLGPVSSRFTLDHLTDQLDIVVSHGAKILVGGDRIPGLGVFLMPTVIPAIKLASPALRQEPFDPVAMFFRTKNEGEAIVNDSPFCGMTRAVYNRELLGFGIEQLVNKKTVCIPDPIKVQTVVASLGDRLYS